MLCRRKTFVLNQVIEPFLTHLLWFSSLATTPKKPQPTPTHLTPSSLLSFTIFGVLSKIESESIQGGFLFPDGGSVSLKMVLNFDRTRAHLFGSAIRVVRIEALQT
ncbi:hypothetical protein Droror1_Dr00027257 [Drosera rotundifolia]